MGWTWRRSEAQSENFSQQLLYEPGNWGDVLKGCWAVEITDKLIQNRSGPAFVFLDPFAGAPEYPVSDAAAQRVTMLANCRFKDLQMDGVRRGLWNSTARCVQLTCAAAMDGGAARLRVFDLDEGRRVAWGRVEGVEVLEIGSGEEAFAKGGGTDEGPDFALIDPYDFFDHWGRLLPLAIRLARRCPVLIYLYNKSPRGKGYLDQYRRMRQRIAKWLPAAQTGFLGRMAADALAPRAFHEVLLLGPAGAPGAFSDVLEASTKALVALVDGQGAFERL